MDKFSLYKSVRKAKKFSCGSYKQQGRTQHDLKLFEILISHLIVWKYYKGIL